MSFNNYYCITTCNIIHYIKFNHNMIQQHTHQQQDYQYTTLYGYIQLNEGISQKTSNK